MILPNKIVETGISLKDQYFDLKGLSSYSSMGVTSLRYHIREHGLPHFAVRNDEGKITKILVKKSEFDQWMTNRWRQNIGAIADEMIESLNMDT